MQQSDTPLLSINQIPFPTVLTYWFSHFEFVGDVYAWSPSLSCSPLCRFHCHGSVKNVSLATSGPLAFVALSDHELKVHNSDVNGQWSCVESRNYEDKVSQP